MQQIIALERSYLRKFQLLVKTKILLPYSHVLDISGPHILCL
jgi:hypothetical protein